jgi:small subunit ribosomal protein S12
MLKKVLVEKNIYLKFEKTKFGFKKVARLRLSTKQKVVAYIPGEGHSLHQYSTVLMREAVLRFTWC